MDMDMHHGDGVELAFYHSNRVTMVSFHKHTGYFFPGTGKPDDNGAGLGKYVFLNVPLQDGIEDDMYLTVIKTVWVAPSDRHLRDFGGTREGERHSGSLPADVRVEEHALFFLQRSMDGENLEGVFDRAVCVARVGPVHDAGKILGAVYSKGRRGVRVEVWGRRPWRGGFSSERS
jgi:hypothetical protein